MNIKEIIQQLRVTMDDAKGQDSHFDSWLTQNEGICKAIDALKILDTQPVAQRPWQGLTEEEIMVIGDKVANEKLVGLVSNFRGRLARAIEQTLKEKNHG